MKTFGAGVSAGLEPEVVHRRLRRDGRGTGDLRVFLSVLSCGRMAQTVLRCLGLRAFGGGWSERWFVAVRR